MTKIYIEKVKPDDIDQLQKIGRKTFNETFSAGNTEENMTKYLEEGFSVEKLISELSDNNSEFYFAILDNRVIGYLKLNFGQSQTELQDHNALEIERIYVLKEFHGKKVGQLLYNKAIQRARQKNACYIWLGVWEENPRAISFYKKNGFVEFDKHVFRLGDDKQTDIMMKLTLDNSSEIWMAGAYFYRHDLKRLVRDLPVYKEDWYATGVLYSIADVLKLPGKLSVNRTVN